MRSFAVWYSEKDKTESANHECTVHINLWDKNRANEKNYYFDIGILVENLQGIDKIYLYTPFSIGKSQIDDLGKIISNNKLVNAIFNEVYTTTDGEPKRLIVKDKNKPEKDFVIYSLETSNQVELIDCYRNDKSPGTIIAINVADILLESNLPNRYYFRVRVKPKNNEVNLINDEVKGISIFSDQFTNTEIIDFRLNDIRSCSEELREQFDKGSKFDILAVHYLILRSADDVIIHHGREISSRMLENDLWSDYIEGDNRNIVAYHMKSKAVVKDKKTEYVDSFSDLSRFQYSKGSRYVIIVYIFVIIILGAIGGVAGNFVTDFLKSFFKGGA